LLDFDRAFSDFVRLPRLYKSTNKHADASKVNLDIPTSTMKNHKRIIQKFSYTLGASGTTVYHRRLLLHFVPIQYFLKYLEKILTS